MTEKKNGKAVNGHIRNIMMVMMMLLMFGDRKATTLRFVCIDFNRKRLCLCRANTFMLNVNNVYHSHSSISDADLFIWYEGPQAALATALISLE